MRTVVLLAIVALILSVIANGQTVGLKMTVTQKGIDYMAAIARDKIQRTISGRGLPGSAGFKSGCSYLFHSGRVVSCGLQPFNVKLVPGSGVDIEAPGVSVSAVMCMYPPD